MEDEDIPPKTHIQPVWTESRACTLLSWNIVYWRDFRTKPTGPAVCTFVFGAIPSLYILRVHLYTTPSSMVQYVHILMQENSY